MDWKEKEMEELGPFTLEEAKEWLHRLEDMTTIERDVGFATRFVLGNLLDSLSCAGVIDGRAFISHLRANLHLIQEAHHRLGAEALLREYWEHLTAPDAPGGSRVYH